MELNPLIQNSNIARLENNDVIYSFLIQMKKHLIYDLFSS